MHLRQLFVRRDHRLKSWVECEQPSSPKDCANNDADSEATCCTDALSLQFITICGAPPLARVILSERSESNCEAVGGEAEQDLTCHAGSRRLEKGYFIKEREGKPLPYRNVIFLHSAEMFVRTVCLKTGG